VSRRGDSPFAEELGRLEVEVRRLAMALVEDVLRRELGGRKAEPARRGKPGRPAKAERRGAKGKRAAKEAPARRGGKPRQTGGKPAAKVGSRGRSKGGARAAAKDEPQLQLGLTAPPPPPASTVEPAEPAAPAATEASAAPAPAGGPPGPSALHTGKRRKWTRESIIEELARWLVNGSSVDASFLTRNGPPGLAAAARRIFGRFDAALNVAGLHVTKLYPDGPPPRPGSTLPGAQQYR
jgi:hypothetical protein